MKAPISDDTSRACSQKIQTVKAAVKRLKLGRAPGSNGLTPDLFGKGGEGLIDRLVSDFAVIWPEKDIPVLQMAKRERGDHLQEEGVSRRSQ
jgi:hypothetical protein